MATTNLNIRTEKAIKDQAEEIFNELGLNMTTAVNMFLRTAIREHGIPFELKLEVPNDTTAAAIEDGRKMMKDLTGNYKGTRECHIEPDWLLIYEIQNNVLVLMLYRLGTHSELYKK